MKSDCELHVHEIMLSPSVVMLSPLGDIYIITNTRYESNRRDVILYLRGAKLLKLYQSKSHNVTQGYDEEKDHKNCKLNIV